MKGDVSPKKDVTELAKEAIGLVQAIADDDKVTLLHCVDVFRGSKIRKVVEFFEAQIFAHSYIADYRQRP